MRIMKALVAAGVPSLLLAAAAGAHAAGPYTLTCTGMSSETITMALTGFTVKLNGPQEAASSGAGAKRSAVSITIRFAPSKDYETLWSMAQDNEVLRSCKLTDTESGAATSSTDDWTMATSKAKKARATRSPLPRAEAHLSGF